MGAPGRRRSDVRGSDTGTLFFEDGDGRISSDELGVVLKALGRKPPGAKPGDDTKTEE